MKDPPHRHGCGSLRSSESIKDRSSCHIEHFSVICISERSGENQIENGLRHIKYFRRDAGQSGLQSAALLIHLNRSRFRLPVTPKRVTVIQATDRLDRRFKLITMMQIQRCEHLMQQSQRASRLDVTLPELL